MLLIDENCIHYHIFNNLINNDDADESDDINGGGERTSQSMIIPGEFFIRGGTTIG